MIGTIGKKFTPCPNFYMILHVAYTVVMHIALASNTDGTDRTAKT